MVIPLLVPSGHYLQFSTKNMTLRMVTLLLLDNILMINDSSLMINDNSPRGRRFINAS